MHSNAIVPGQCYPIIFLITNIFFKRGLHTTPCRPLLCMGVILGVDHRLSHRFSLQKLTVSHSLI